MFKSQTVYEINIYRRGPCLPTGQRERVDVNAKDDTGCTALHYAALSGLKKCVEYLLAHGADPYCENKSGLTPCDLAMRENHHDIALLLESKMVFTGTPDELSSRRYRNTQVHLKFDLSKKKLDSFQIFILSLIYDEAQACQTQITVLPHNKL